MTTRADILWQIKVKNTKVTQLTSCLLPFTFQMADYGFSPSSVLQLNFSKDFCFHFVSECSRGRVWYQSMMFLCSEFQYCDTTKNRQQQAWRGKQSVQFSSLVLLIFFCAVVSHVSSAFRGVRLHQEKSINLNRPFVWKLRTGTKGKGLNFIIAYAPLIETRL